MSVMNTASTDASNGIRSVPSQHLPLQPQHFALSQQTALQSINSQQFHRPVQPLPMQGRTSQTPRPQQAPFVRQPGSFSSQNQSRSIRPSDGNARRRARKVIGDGFEASYSQAGPNNRLVLSLKSGLPSQIDWALSRLAQHSVTHRDLSLDSLVGLADTLLSYVRRVCDAIAGKPAQYWHTTYYEQSTDLPDVGIGAPGEGGFQGASTWYIKPSPQSRTKQHVVLANKTTSHCSFQPSQDQEHADLLRRGLEASLILRNLALQSSNARHLASIEGFYALIRDVLALPAFHLDRSASTEHVETRPDLDLDEISELRLYFLDILEALAHKLVLTGRARSSTVPSLLAGPQPLSYDRSQPDHAQGTSVAQAEPIKLQEPSSSDDIFPRLLQMVHLTNDRALLLSSLRCLSAMAAVDKNEMAFLELEMADGTCSPGLLARCVELLPVTNDLELLEAVLDLLYQLVCIGDNGFRLTAAPPQARSVSATPDETSQLNLQSDGAAGAFSKAAALVRLLTRNLQIGRTIWERDHKLFLHREWTPAVPSKMRETIRKERETRIRLANESPEERAQKKKLSPKERQALAGLTEPERGIKWMKTVFKGNPANEVTQMEFWTTYKEEFGNEQGIALQPAADLIRTVSQIFPGAAAMVIQGVNGAPNRFIIRGIEVSEREHPVSFQCCWQSCPAPLTITADAQQRHARTHASYSRDGRCRWLNCDFEVASLHSVEALDAHAVNSNLLAHVLTHLSGVQSDSFRASDKDAKPAKEEDEESHTEASVAHTGIAPDFEKAIHANGARYISGKRNAEGEQIRFDMPTTTSAVNRSNMQSDGDESSTMRSGQVGSGTVDNPGLLTFEVVRTPSAGADEWPSPQGPAYVSLLILRMLTRNAAHLLRKAGPTLATDEPDDVNSATIRGEGEDKFGLPLPASFSGEATTKKSDLDNKADADIEGNQASDNSYLATTTESWAVESAARFMDAIGSVEDELVLHSYQNDILARYINETLVELRNQTDSPKIAANGSIDPVIAMAQD